MTALAAALLGATLAAYLTGVRRAEQRLRSPWPRARTLSFVAGVAVLFGALVLLDARAHDRFWVHMAQHLLITFVAAPLLLAGAPVTLLRRGGPSGSARVVALVLRSAPARALTHPAVAWIAFTAVMWGTHFTPLYDAAISNAAVHAVEHVLYLSASLLFWFPIVGIEPSRARLPSLLRVLYLFTAIPVSALLGVAIFSADAPLYPSYALGPDPLADQRAAGAMMWVAGGLGLLLAVLIVAAVWARAERAHNGAEEPQPALSRIKP